MVGKYTQALEPDFLDSGPGSSVYYLGTMGKTPGESRSGFPYVKWGSLCVVRLVSNKWVTRIGAWPVVSL